MQATSESNHFHNLIILVDEYTEEYILNSKNLRVNSECLNQLSQILKKIYTKIDDYGILNDREDSLKAIKEVKELWSDGCMWMFRVHQLIKKLEDVKSAFFELEDLIQNQITQFKDLCRFVTEQCYALSLAKEHENIEMDDGGVIYVFCDGTIIGYSKYVYLNRDLLGYDSDSFLLYKKLQDVNPHILVGVDEILAKKESKTKYYQVQSPEDLESQKKVELHFESAFFPFMTESGQGLSIRKLLGFIVHVKIMD